MSLERAGITMRGMWRDELIFDGGRTFVTGWQSNQIQLSAAKLVASLLKGEFAVDPSFLPLKYMAIGSGDVSWDSVTPSKPRSQESLTDEVLRIEIPSANARWMDDFTTNGGQIVTTPSRFISLSATIPANQANTSLREFGLFGGDANSVAGSGIMFNWVVHPKIDKDSSLTIVRTVEIEIKEPTP